MNLLTRLFLLSVLVCCSCVKAPTVEVNGICETGLRLTVADEFRGTAVKLAEDFSKRTGNRVCITTGTNGEIVEKIRLGFQYDVFMSGGTEYPELLAAEGQAESPVVYALGTIALYSTYWKVNRAWETYLWSSEYKTLAVADPEKSPYGRPAVETLAAMGLYEKVADKLVYSESIVDTLSLVRAKEADAGFVAWPELRGKDKRWAWLVPEDLHEPIELAAVVLKTTGGKDAATLWMQYIMGEAGRAILLKDGYRVEGGAAGG